MERNLIMHSVYSCLLYTSNRDSLVSIGVFSEEGDVIAAEPLTYLKESVQPEDQDWFVRATEKIENLHFSTPHVQNLFINTDNQYRWVVSLSRAVELTYGGSISNGVMQMCIRDRHLPGRRR